MPKWIDRCRGEQMSGREKIFSPDRFEEKIPGFTSFMDDFVAAASSDINMHMMMTEGPGWYK